LTKSVVYKLYVALVN